MKAIARVGEFLQGVGVFGPNSSVKRPWWWLPLMIVIFAPLYGAVMGSFHFISTERIWLVGYSAIKLPLLLFSTTVLCLPGYLVINTIAGLRDDLYESMQAIFAGQASTSIALASLAPLTRVWYFSDSSYRAAILFNAAMLGTATLAGHLVTLRYYRPLIRRNRLHQWMAYSWLVLYAFVGIQLGWMLRPFVGDPNAPVSFFRQEPFSNAYVVLSRLILG